VQAARQDRPRRHPDSAFRLIGEDGGLVVLPGRSEVKVLNPTGARIFSLLDGTRTREEIASVVAEEFEVTNEQASQDVDEFLDELGQHGMIADPAAREQEITE